MDALRPRVQADIDPGLAQHADHRLADRLIIDVAVVRAVQGDVEPAAIAGLVEKRRDQVRVRRGVLEAGRETVPDAVVVGADADVIHACQRDDVVDVVDHVPGAGLDLGIGGVEGVALLLGPVVDQLLFLGVEEQQVLHVR